MTASTRLHRLTPLVLIALAAPALAAPADVVRARQEGYKALGSAFKSVNDGLRASPPPLPAMQAAAARIRATAAQQFKWFPAGTGPQPGVKTDAKAAIWTQPAQFRQAQTAFATQAAAFETAVKGGDVGAIRTASRALGATCKGCHDQFRTEK